MQSTGDQQPGLWQRIRAYWWYAWGMSSCYWGIRSAEQALFREGIRSFDRALKIWPEFAQVIRAISRRSACRNRKLTTVSEFGDEPQLARGGRTSDPNVASRAKPVTNTLA